MPETNQNNTADSVQQGNDTSQETVQPTQESTESQGPKGSEIFNRAKRSDPRSIEKQANNDGTTQGQTEQDQSKQGQGEQTQNVQDQSAAEGAPTTKGPAAQSGTFMSDEQFQSLLGTLRETAAPQQQVQQQPELTDEQRNKLLKKPQITGDLVDRMLAGGEDSVAAMAEFAEQVSQHAMTVSQLQAAQLREQISQQYEPYIKIAQQAQSQERVQKFLGQYPDLQAHPKAVTLAINELISEGFNETDETKAFKALADRTKNILKEIRGDSSSNQQTAPQQNNQNQQSKPANKQITPVSTGGQGGASGASGSGQDLSSGHRIFANRR